MQRSMDFSGLGDTFFEEYGMNEVGASVSDIMLSDVSSSEVDGSSGGGSSVGGSSVGGSSGGGSSGGGSDDGSGGDQKDRRFGLNWSTFLYFLRRLLIFILCLPYRLVRFVLKFSYTIIYLLFIAMLVGAIGGGYVFFKVLPMYEEASAQAYEKLSTLSLENFQRLENTTVYDCNGKVIGSINAGDYHYAEINDISMWVQKGYIAQEDKRFMEHCGIDIQSLARAGISLVRNHGEITQGGSTITQQVIKNCLLTQEQTYSRKLVEVLLAPKLEQMFSKADIMEFYCNTAYYGNLCYGIDTASRYYFGKKAKDLTLGESAMLCGVSNSPNNYNPVASMELAVQKRDQVLASMVRCEFITEEEAELAKAEKVKLKVEDNAQQSDNYMVSYAVHCLSLELMEQDGFKFKYVFKDSKDQKKYKEAYAQVYKEKSSLIRSGGYKIYTSFDRKLQKSLQKSINEGLKGYKQKQSNGKYALQGAGVCIDNETGYVVAIVGGRGTKDEYNRAFLSQRQPGSTIKPLLDYAPAINEGLFNPSSVLVDQPVYAVEGDTSSYSPKNSGGGYRGSMTLREALAYSINTVAYQVFQKLGNERAVGYLEKLHFTSLSFADNSVEALALGGFTNGCTVADMARGYATLAMGGNYTTLNCLKSVVFQGGEKVFEAKELGETCTPVFTQDTAYMMTDMMQGTFEVKGGTASRFSDDNIIQAGKTGTTSSNKDAWFCGYTQFYTTAIWVGYDTPKEMTGMYGGTVSATIWSDYMRGISKNMEAVDFSRPESVTLRKVSGGEYKGEDIEPKEGVRTYLQRKKGTEWFSSLNRPKYEKSVEDTALQMALKKAETAVDDFCSWVISNTSDAQRLDDMYAIVLSAIDEVTDDYKVSELKERVAEHYELLSGEVRDTWMERLAERAEEEAEEAKATARLRAEDSLHSAENELKEGRLAKADWYLDAVNNRQYYTDVTRMLIDGLRKAVKRLRGYSEYDDYVASMEQAISVAKEKPTTPEVPVTPEDDEDAYEPDIDDFPTDTFE